MLLTDDAKAILENALDILDIGSPAVCEYTYETDDGAKICFTHSSSSELCVAVKCLLSQYVLPTKTVPVIMQFAMSDIKLTKGGFEFVSTDQLLLDRYIIVVQVGGEVVFKAILPNPNGSERLNVSVYTKGMWCNDLDIIKQFLYPSSKSKKNYFIGCNNRTEIQARYRSLMKLYHPDSEIGLEEVAKVINLQYDALTKNTVNEAI